MKPEIDIDNLPAISQLTEFSLGTDSVRKRQAIFLSTLAKTGRYTPALKAIYATRAMISRWVKTDATFKELLDLAELEAMDALEDEAYRRAVDGVDEPVVTARGLIYDENGEILTIKKYSNDILKLLLTNNHARYQAKANAALPTGLLVVPLVATEDEWKMAAEKMTDG